jgi:allantoicase
LAQREKNIKGEEKECRRGVEKLREWEVERKRENKRDWIAVWLSGRASALFKK